MQHHKQLADRLAAGQQPGDFITAQIVGQPMYEVHTTKCLCKCQDFPTGMINLMIPSKSTENMSMMSGSTIRIVPPWYELQLDGEHPVVVASLVA